MKTYTEEELREQKQVIKRVLETGSPAEVEKLKQAFRDPELHPEIRDLIVDVFRDLHIADVTQGTPGPEKAKGTIDLDVARLAKEGGKSVQEALQLDKVVRGEGARGGGTKK